MVWETGKSGNPNGRPKGRGGKLTNRQLAEELSKGCKTALNTILRLMQKESAADATKLRAAVAWLAQDKAMRDMLYKEVQDRLKNNEKPEAEIKSSSENKKEFKVLSLPKRD